MTDRTVKVSLIAMVNGYVSGMRQAQQETSKTSTELERQQEQHKNLTTAINATGIAIGAMGAIAAAGVALAVKKFADFDAQMSQVQALSHANTEEMAALSNAALTAGQKIGLTANQVADAETELVKAGISVSDMLGGSLTGALNLAAAGQIDVAESTQIAAVAMTQFHLAGKDVPHLADLLAAGADKALGGVDQLGQALNQSGLVASQFGLSIEDTVATLSAFANAGLLGSDAGTSFKTMLLSLASPSKNAQDTMKGLGIAAYDANGQFVGISALAEQLKTKMSGLSQSARDSALSIIFGTDAIRAANVLYKEGGDGIDKWRKNVDDSGFAAEQAEAKMNNLNGDVTKLGAAFDTALIKSGSTANDALRGLVQTATELVAGFANLPPVFQQGAFALAAFTAAVGLAGGAALLLVPKFVEFQKALDVLAMSKMPGVAAAATSMSRSVAAAGDTLSKTAKFLMGPWGVALAAAVVGVDLLSKYLDSLQASSEQITNSLKTAKTAADIFNQAGQGKDVKWLRDVRADLNDLPAVLQAAADQSSNLFARFDSTHFGAFDALKQIGDQLGALAQSDLPAAQHAFSLLAEKTDGSQKELWRLLNTMPGYKDALVAQASELGINVTSSDEAANKTNLLKLAQEGATTSTDENAKALAQLSGVAQDAQGDISDLADQIAGFGKAQFDLNASQRDFEAAIDDQVSKLKDQADAYKDAHGSLDGFTNSLDIGTENGRENSAALDQIAQSALSMASNLLNTTGSQDEATGAIQRGRDALINALAQFGITGQAADEYANKLGLIPGNVNTLVNLNKTQAEKDAEAFITKLNNIQRHIDVQVQVHGADNIYNTGGYRVAQADGGVVDYYARGGIRERHVAQIAPAGAFRVWAEPETGGEAYIPLAQAKRQRSLAIWQETGKRLGVQGFASGGIVGGAVPAAMNSYNVNITAPAIETQDSRVYATIIGREFARRVAG